MKKIIYGLFCLHASFLLSLTQTANAADSNEIGLEGAFNIAYYYVQSPTQYSSVTSRRYVDYYRDNRDGRHHASTQRSRRAPPPPVVKPPEKIDSDGRATFIFNPNELNWGAYDEEGYLVNFGRASGGQGYCSDIRRGCKTPSGIFSVYRKGGPDCKSSKFPLGKGGAPMGWCMFFRGGYAIHASHDVPGRNASHGCIRVVPDAARWLSHEFMKIGTKVIVRSY